MLLLDFNQIWISRRIFISVLYIKLHRNPFSARWAGVHAEKRKDARTDMMKLTDAFRDSVNVPKNRQFWDISVDTAPAKDEYMVTAHDLQ